MKERWFQFRIRLIRTLAIHAPRRRMNWLYYTIIFGSLPIAIRIVVAFATSSGQVDLFAPADFAFYGIMLNTAAIANVTAGKKYSPDLIAGVMTVAITHIVLLVSIYCVALFPDISKAATLAIGFIVLASSLLFSYLTIDREFMSDIKMGFDMANARDAINPFVLSCMDLLDEQRKSGEKPNLGEDAIFLLDKNGYRLDPETMNIVKKSPS